MERIENQFAWEKTSDKRQFIFKSNYYDGQWHYNQHVWRYKQDQKQMKSGNAHGFSDQFRVKNSR